MVSAQIFFKIRSDQIRSAPRSKIRPSVARRVAVVLQHRHDARDQQQREHDRRGDRLGLLGLLLGLVRALAHGVVALGRLCVFTGLGVVVWWWWGGVLCGKVVW